MALHNSTDSRAPTPAAFMLILTLLATFSGSSPASTEKIPAGHRTETATLAGGCFWSMNAIFQRLRGVERVVAGFSGGTARNPSYEEVCAGSTGHAESIQITFDPAVISYRELLEIFFVFHDPTTLDRQGADEGAQYRSIIFWHAPAQRAVAEQVIAELTRNRTFRAAIVTQVVPYVAFYPADAHHQGYYDKNAKQSYCSIVIAPKLAKLKKVYASKLKP